ncbi:hypothetical protein PCANC_28799 [Puccinia coronata f. sp. avenae]|uniref:Uncharacterized protein n=1 Tax=Puccinia coronata f. sp. avenae TaxID=200324 RepID=A0A2N5THE7_9BASI|nr:hypothetical protein PCANC_28799 [Puccinia coronata f. sp. avenae]
MCVYREEEDRLKRLKAVEKEAAKARSSSTSSSRGRGCGRGRPRNAQSQSTTSSQSKSLSSTLSFVPDSNPAFILEDYQNICMYLEDEKNYQQLYGSGSKTSVGLSPVSKSATYNIFAIFINDCSSRGLCLTGKQLRSQIDTYRKKFAQTKNWAKNTGAGIEEQDGEAFLAEKLERMCPCYERMYKILGFKHNITPLVSHDSINGIGEMVSLGSDTSNDLDQHHTSERQSCSESQSQRSHPDSDESMDNLGTSRQSQTYLASASPDISRDLTLPSISDQSSPGANQSSQTSSQLSSNMLSSSHSGSTALQAQQGSPTPTLQAQQATPTPRMASGSSAGEQDLDTSSCCHANHQQFIAQ